MSLLTLSIGFFIVGIIFSFVLRVFKLSEEKLKELGFLGFTISIVTTFLKVKVQIIIFLKQLALDKNI